MKHNRFLVAAFAAAALISAPTTTSAAGLAAASGLRPGAPASDLQLVHTHPFKHCHACGHRPVYICHTVGPTPICPPSTRVYRPPRHPR